MRRHDFSKCSPTLNYKALVMLKPMGVKLYTYLFCTGLKRREAQGCIINACIWGRGHSFHPSQIMTMTLVMLKK